MRRRTMIVLTLALCFIGAGVSFAKDLNLGTWKLNEAKSNIPAGATKNTTVVYESVGKQIKVTTDGTGQDGHALHTEWTGKFDSKDYPLSGDPTADTRSYTKTDDHGLTVTNKKSGKIVASGQIVIAPDGRSRTLTLTGTDSSGQKITSMAVYDKQ